MASPPQLRQERKIQEIGEALIAEGLTTLGKQAAALGLVRSTAWFILQAKQKRAGITTATLDRMLESPHLPPDGSAEGFGIRGRESGWIVRA